jgi:acyl CoA:acetate/3-ketoacid CoA transferase beta subunit
MAAVAKRTVLYTTRHSSEVLVADCSVRSTPGWHVPDHVAGPTACITPAGVFDFPAPAHRMRLVHLRPEWTATSVQAATGFALAGLDTATPVPPATLDELSVLRARVDQLGVLR